MPIDYTRRSYPGAAANTTLNGSIGSSDATIVITSATGWPDGSGGPFFCVIDQGLTTEEKILVGSRTGTSLSVTTRGADQTIAVSHASTAAIFPCFSATDADSANAHYNDVADNHAQYLNNTRHDTVNRHQFGGALGVPAAPPSTAGASAAGSGSSPARSDHTHAIGSGSVVAGSFAAGAVNTNDLAANAVTTAKIASAAVTDTQLSTTGVTANTYGNAFQFPQLTVNAQGRITAGSQITLATYGSYQTSAKPANWSITSIGSWVVMANSTVTITNPSRKLNINARATGYMSQGTDNSTDVYVRMGVSTDGGTTWSYGGGDTSTYYHVKCGINPPVFGNWAVEADVDGVTPSGDIKARLEVQQPNAGTAISVNAVNVCLAATVSN